MIKVLTTLKSLSITKDSTGTWQKIECRFPYGCGLGINSIILPPDKIAISSITDYKGDFRTSLRLKMGNKYSNEINTTINYNQFDKESRWD